MKISLIITVFNSAKYVASAIDSFLAQDYLDKELIILDGKSTDKSHEIIAKYAENSQISNGSRKMIAEFRTPETLR